MREIIELDPSWALSVCQSFYVLPERRGLYPNRIFINKASPEPQILFETNSWGLKGPEPDGSKPILVVWGDSVIFGIGQSWVDKLNELQSRYLVLNGGIEGDGPINILRRMYDINRAHKVAVNVFFPGWHDRPGYAYDPPDFEWLPKPTLAQALPKVLQKKESFGTLIFCTLPSWLSPALIEKDVPSYFVPDDSFNENHFCFWASLVYSKDLAQRIYQHVQERNALMRETAASYGLGLIDLEKRIPIANMEQATEYFFDVCHFRPKVYDRLSKILLEELETQLGAMT